LKWGVGREDEQAKKLLKPPYLGWGGGVRKKGDGQYPKDAKE